MTGGSVRSEIVAEPIAFGFLGGPNLDYVTHAVPPGGEYLSIRDITHLEKAFVDTVLTDRKDGLVMGEISVDGGGGSLASLY